MEWLSAHCLDVFSLRQWRHVLFADESRFLFCRSDRKQRVYRRHGKRFSDARVLERDRVGGGRLEVCAGISHSHKTPLIFIDGSLTAD